MILIQKKGDSGSAKFVFNGDIPECDNDVSDTIICCGAANGAQYEF